MKNFQIENIKQFMNDLLVQERFDSFYLFEARVKTSLDYYVNGKLHYEFYDGADDEDNRPTTEYIVWKDVKQTVFDFMKGTRLPLRFKIVLMFNRENIERLVEMNNLPISVDDVGALFMNLIYEDGTLSVITGASMKMFTLDKSLEHLWDDTVEKYYIN